MGPHWIALIIILVVIVIAIVLFFIRNHKDKSESIRELLADEELLLPEINEPKIDPSA